MSTSSDYPRRRAIKHIALSAVTLGSLSTVVASAAPRKKKETPYIMKGNINHSVCRWCYGSIPLEEFCAAVKGLGMTAIDLVGPKEWPTLQKYGLYSSMCNGAEINLDRKSVV